MSVLHVTKNGRKATFWLKDNKSALLDRYVNLDTGQMYYTMCKQIGGKPIKPNGNLGRHLIALSEQLMQHVEKRPHTKANTGWKTSVWWVSIILLVLWLMLR